MNKQELIKEFEEIGIHGLNMFGTVVKGIPTETAIDLIKQLDEPQPLKLKDIISRMKQLFPLSRSEWIDEILHEFGEGFGSIKYREGFEQGKLEGAWVGNQLKDADKIRQELNKPVVPQFVADWYEKNKDDFEFNVWDWIAFRDEPEKLENKEFNDGGENGYVTVEDETGETTDIYLTYWSWGDYFTIDVDNLVDFSAWLQEREVEPIGDCDPWAWLDSLVDDYEEESEK